LGKKTVCHRVIYEEYEPSMLDVFARTDRHVGIEDPKAKFKKTIQHHNHWSLEERFKQKTGTVCDRGIRSTIQKAWIRKYT